MTGLLRVIAAPVAVLVVSVGGASAGSHACLHGESSMAVSLVDGHYVVTQPPTVTGCTP